MSKDYGFIKSSKAKLSYVPSGVASLLTPDCERNGKSLSVLRSTTLRGDAPVRAGLIGDPSR